MSAVEDLSQERRITFCLYEYWEKLAGESGLPALKNMNRNEIAPFKKNLVLLDLRNGQDNPTFQVIGQDLMEDLDDDLTNKPVSSVPRRTMLSRVTDHYMEVLANRVPIAFEAEFVNKEGEKALYRGILLPFSDDNKNINFILGGVRWILEKDVTLDDTKPTIEELMRQIAQGREDYEPEAEQEYDTAATADEETTEFAEKELNDGFSETEVTDEILEQDIITEDGIGSAVMAKEEANLSDFNMDEDEIEMTLDENQEKISVDQTEDYFKEEDEDDILSLDVEAEDEGDNLIYSKDQDELTDLLNEESPLELDGQEATENNSEHEINAEDDSENFVNSESENEIAAFDLDNNDYSTETATEENSEKVTIQEHEYDNIQETEEQFVVEDQEEPSLGIDLESETEMDISPIMDLETTFDKTENTYQSTTSGGLRRKIFLPMDEQMELSKPDLDVEDEIMLSEPVNAEDTDNDNLSSFSALVDAIQNEDEKYYTSQDDLTETELRETELSEIETEQLSTDISEPHNAEESDFMEAADSLEETHHEPEDKEMSDEESFLNTVSDEDVLLNLDYDSQQEEIDDGEIEDILELTEVAEEEVVSDDSGESSIITNFDENKEISDFLDVEDTASIEDDFINELTSEPHTDEKPKTLENLLSEENTSEEVITESAEDLNKTEESEDLGIEGQDDFETNHKEDIVEDQTSNIENTTDIGPDFEISEPETLVNEENEVEDKFDHEEENFVHSIEEDLDTTIDTELSDSHIDNARDDDDDLSIEELMQSIIAERKFDQAYVREQALREEQKQNDNLVKDDQNKKSDVSTEHLPEEIESEISVEDYSEGEELISISDTNDEELNKDQADIEIATAYETMLEEELPVDEIETSVPNEETDITFGAEVASDQSSEILEAGEQEINVEFDDALKHSTPSESDIAPFEADEVKTVQSYETDPANLVSDTASVEIADTKADKPKKRGSVIERAMAMLSPRTIKDKSDVEVAEQVLGKLETLENDKSAPNENTDPIETQQEDGVESGFEPKIDDDFDDFEDTNKIAFEELAEIEDDHDRTEANEETTELEGQIDETVMDSIETQLEENEVLPTDVEIYSDQEKEVSTLEQDGELKTEPFIKDQIDNTENSEPDIESSGPNEPHGQTLPQLRDTLKQVVGYIKKEDANHNRSRDSLYNILTAIYEFYDICEKSSDAFDTIVKENGLKIQSRAPYTPVLKICLGKDYDKTRLTEYAAALGIGHYMNVDVSEFHAFIKNFPGGIKGCVKEMRNIRKHGASGNITARKTRTVEEAREILRDMAPIASFRLKKIIVGNNVDEFCLLLAKRDGHDINVLKILDDKYTKLEPILKRAAFIKGNLNDRK